MTRTLRSQLVLAPLRLINKPFKTVTGLKEDSITEGYNPAVTPRTIAKTSKPGMING